MAPNPQQQQQQQLTQQQQQQLRLTMQLQQQQQNAQQATMSMTAQPPHSQPGSQLTGSVSCISQSVPTQVPQQTVTASQQAPVTVSSITQQITHPQTQVRKKFIRDILFLYTIIFEFNSFIKYDRDKTLFEILQSFRAMYPLVMCKLNNLYLATGDISGKVLWNGSRRQNQIRKSKQDTYHVRYRLIRKREIQGNCMSLQLTFSVS